MAVGHLERVGIADVDLLLARPPFALGVLDRDAGALQALADGAHHALLLGGLQDVVVLDVAAGGLEAVDSASAPRSRSSRRTDRTRARRRSSARHAALGEPRDLLLQDRARANAAHRGGDGRARRTAPARCPRARACAAASPCRASGRSRRSPCPSSPPRSRAPAPCRCRWRAGSCRRASPRARRRRRTRPGSACRSGGPACRPWRRRRCRCSPAATAAFSCVERQIARHVLALRLAQSLARRCLHNESRCATRRQPVSSSVVEPGRSG